MRDFGLPRPCELEICPSEYVHTAIIAAARRCGLRHVFCGFMLIVLLRFVKEISFNRYYEDKRILTARQEQDQNWLCC
jgi:hypothetical protein